MSPSFTHNVIPSSLFNLPNGFVVADDRSEIQAWLSSLEPRLSYEDAQDCQFDNADERLLQTGGFGGWRDGSGGGDGSENGVLFCCGNPGVGKTDIRALMADSLCGQAIGQDAASAYFDFDFATRKPQLLKSMLGSPIKKVVGGLDMIPEEVSQTLKDQKNVIGGRGPLLPDIVTMLQATTSPQRPPISIDSLCECVAGHRVELLDSLREKENFQKSPGIGGLYIRAGTGRCPAG